MNLTSKERELLEKQLKETCRTWFGAAEPESMKEHIVGVATTLLLFEHSAVEILWTLLYRSYELRETDMDRGIAYLNFVHEVMVDALSEQHADALYRAWADALEKKE